MVRPTADKLKHRCTANSHVTGRRCGSPAAEGFTLCRAHMGPDDRKQEKTTAERLVKLTRQALDAIESVILTGPPDAKVRAAKLVLDRTAPVSSLVLNSITVNTAHQDPSVIIRERLDALRAMGTIEPTSVQGGIEQERTDGAESPSHVDIVGPPTDVEAESPVTVDEEPPGVIPPEPPVAPALGQHGSTAAVPERIIVQPSPVQRGHLTPAEWTPPRVTVRPGSFERMAREQVDGRR